MSNEYSKVTEEYIEIETKCPSCMGKGYNRTILNIDELLRMRTEVMGWENKIKFIKEVRTRWDLGLRDAKEIVEAVETFRNLLQGIVNTNRGEQSWS